MGFYALVKIKKTHHLKELIHFMFTGFPLGLENLAKWEEIFQSWNFNQTGNIRENSTKYYKTEGISDKCQLLFFSDS